MTFENKTIWITGASSGIGEALAIEWASQRPNLILSGRNIDKLEGVKKICISKGAKCVVVPIDLTSSTSISDAANAVFSAFDTVDILVNNGGISQRSTAIETSIETDRTIMETNFFGAINLSKQVLPYMLKSGSGHIVVIGSIVGKFGFPLRTAYSASKHALQGYFESLRAELSSKNIKVTIVSPGSIATNISINAVDKNGNKYGIMDDAQGKGMPVDICARKIISAVKSYKRDVLIGRSELLMVFIHKFVPTLYYKLASKVKPT
jgi:dehydrogenase/reductase SDR family protein 7B